MCLAKLQGKLLPWSTWLDNIAKDWTGKGVAILTCMAWDVWDVHIRQKYLFLFWQKQLILMLKVRFSFTRLKDTLINMHRPFTCIVCCDLGFGFTRWNKWLQNNWLIYYIKINVKTMCLTVFVFFLFLINLNLEFLN